MKVNCQLIAAGLAAFLCLSGCVSQPNNTRAAISETTVFLGKQADRAERNHWITNDEEDRIINQLIQVNQLLLGESVLFEGIDCTDKRDLDCAGLVLDLIERQLIEAEKNGG